MAASLEPFFSAEKESREIKKREAAQNGMGF